MAHPLDQFWQSHLLYWLPSLHLEPQQQRYPESLVTEAAATAKQVAAAPTSVVQQPLPSSAASATAVAASARLAAKRAFASEGGQGSRLACPPQLQLHSAVLHHIDASSVHDAVGGG